MALDADAAWPLKWEVSFLLNQADVSSLCGLFQALGSRVQKEKTRAPMPFRLYRAIISAPDSASVDVRAEVMAESAEDAKAKLEAEYGEGRVYSLWSEEEGQASRPSQYVRILAALLMLATCAAVGPLGGIPVLIAGLIAWPIARWVASLIDRRFKSTGTRVGLGILTFLLVLTLASIVQLGLTSAIKSNPPPPSVQPIASAAPARMSLTSLTEDDLQQLAKKRNESLPAITSPEVELTRVDAGPGRRLTYRVRILIKGASKSSLSDADIANIRRDAVKEACVEFKPGLQSGITYVMAYSSEDGSELFTLPITITDC